MAWRTTFATLTQGDQPLSLFDQQFNDMGMLTVVPCTATGTNAIALAPNGFTATQSSYANYQLYGFVAPNNSTGNVTVNVNSIGALNLYAADGVTQIGSGQISSGVYYEIVYNSALNSAAGGFQIVGEMPISNALDLIGATQGDILYRDSGGWKVLAPGTNGQFLESQGAAANPKWATAGNAPFSAKFTSTQQSLSGLTSGGTVTVAHGLGAAPFATYFLLHCISAEGGYSIGDEVVLQPGLENEVTTIFGVSAYADSTNVNLIVNSSGTIGILNKSAFTFVQITLSKWNLIVKAWV